MSPSRPMLQHCVNFHSIASTGTLWGRPIIAYVSRTLTSAEKNYSQIEKEGLAIVFGVKKFHNYLYGCQFSIESDHQPLSCLFSESRAIPQMASSRIQRWALTLSAYQYTLCYKAGSTLANADSLSC